MKSMKRVIFWVVIVALIGTMAYILLNQPFLEIEAIARQFNLKFVSALRPQGVYLEDQTVWEVLKLRFSTETVAQRVLSSLLMPFPRKWRLLASGVLFLFPVIVVMAALRVLPLRWKTTLFLGIWIGTIVYWYFPDFVSGKRDDFGILMIPISWTFFKFWRFIKRR